jgi:hypothetical protein
LHESFPDPSKFIKEEEFVYAAKVSSVFKKVVVELLGWFDGQSAMAEHLTAKKEGKLIDRFTIGRD